MKIINYSETMNGKIQKCKEFFDNLAEVLQNEYEVVGSCNNDISAYLIPNGTNEEISYYSKPLYSFRLSDHWNWYSNLKKCSNANYIQCESVDMPRARERIEKSKASKPIFGVQVGFMDRDNKYHCVYGEIYDRKNHCWTWKESNPQEIVIKVLPQLKKISK